MTAFVTAYVNLLPLFYSGYAEHKLISQLNTFFQIDYNIFLFDSSANINRFINTESQPQYSPQSLHVFKNVDGNITGIRLEVFNKTRNKNEFLIVVSPYSNFESNLNLLTQVKDIQSLRLNLKIGLFFANFGSANLRQLFDWSWKNRIISIFAATQTNSESSLSIFTYNPFGTFEVINVTNSSFNNYFLSQRSNFQQYPLLLSEKENIEVVSRSFKILRTVFQVMNSSYKFLNKSSINQTSPSYDIFYRIITKSESNPDYFYPVEMPSYTILAPEVLPYAEFLSYLQNILASEFCIYASITIVMIMIMLAMVRYMKQKKILFFESVADVVNLLMNDNSKIEYQRLNRNEVLLIVPLTFVGLVITNGILSNLQSHITQPFPQPQISTIEEVYRSDSNKSFT